MIQRTLDRRLGIVLSAGGAAFEATARIVAESGIMFHVVTDRECGGEGSARNVGAPVTRIEERSRTLFSQRTFQVFRDSDIHRCLLFFDRLVSTELFDAMQTYNIHPAILPAFRGLTGVADAHAHRARLLGCSLHQVDASVDGGPLLAQIARGVDPGWPVDRWEKLAYLMKVYCALVWCSDIFTDRSDYFTPINASHGLPSRWFSAFLQLQDEVGEVIVQSL